MNEHRVMALSFFSSLSTIISVFQAGRSPPKHYSSPFLKTNIHHGHWEKSIESSTQISLWMGPARHFSGLPRSPLCFLLGDDARARRNEKETIAHTRTHRSMKKILALLERQTGLFRREHLSPSRRQQNCLIMQQLIRDGGEEEYSGSGQCEDEELDHCLFWRQGQEKTGGTQTIGDF